MVAVLSGDSLDLTASGRLWHGLIRSLIHAITGGLCCAGCALSDAHRSVEQAPINKVARVSIAYGGHIRGWALEYERGRPDARLWAFGAPEAIVVSGTDRDRLWQLVSRLPLRGWGETHSYGRSYTPYFSVVLYSQDGTMTQYALWGGFESTEDPEKWKEIKRIVELWVYARGLFGSSSIDRRQELRELFDVQ